MAILVSKSDHCLYDLLIRHQSGELPCEIPVIVSNHPDLEHVARQFGIPFRHLPMEAGVDKEARARACAPALFGCAGRGPGHVRDRRADAAGACGAQAAKAAQEAAMEALLEAEKIDLIVMARYMQARTHAARLRLHTHWLGASRACLCAHAVLARSACAGAVAAILRAQRCAHHQHPPLFPASL
jgi:hypothetical protein